MHDTSLRLRRAITQNNVSLVTRILKNNPTYLQNPDYQNKSNTSLHLAATNGFLDIVKLLISVGHDSSDVSEAVYAYQHSVKSLGISHNTDGHTPLHLAAAHSHASVVDVLCKTFASTINLKDNGGLAPLHLASRGQPVSSSPPTSSSMRSPSKSSEDTSTIENLLEHGANVDAEDASGNTALHYASAWGNLKAVRVLIQAGIDPMCRNHEGWLAEHYSLTVQAEVYYRNLVAEWEKRKAEESMRQKDRAVRGVGGLRLVTTDEDDNVDQDTADNRDRANSGGGRYASRSGGASAISRSRADSWK